jgi:hypothetical protein
MPYVHAFRTYFVSHDLADARDRLPSLLVGPGATERMPDGFKWGAEGWREDARKTGDSVLRIYLPAQGKFPVQYLERAIGGERDEEFCYAGLKLVKNDQGTGRKTEPFSRHIDQILYESLLEHGREAAGMKRLPSFTLKRRSFMKTINVQLIRHAAAKSNFINVQCDQVTGIHRTVDGSYVNARLIDMFGTPNNNPDAYLSDHLQRAFGKDWGVPVDGSYLEMVKRFSARFRWIG